MTTVPDDQKPALEEQEPPASTYLVGHPVDAELAGPPAEGALTQGPPVGTPVAQGRHVGTLGGFDRPGPGTATVKAHGSLYGGAVDELPDAP
jgi:hypothetical protein